MDIAEALKIIKRTLRKNVVESRHFKEQCRVRTLNTSIIREKVNKNKILGILEQDDGLYKIWFFYDKYKDLNIILRILPNKTLKFITLFPCSSERRKR